jgi:hypothetical protein
MSAAEAGMAIRQIGVGGGDAALLELERQLLAAEAAVVAQETAPDLDDPYIDPVMDRYWQVADQIVATPAQGVVGQQVKARALRSIWNMLEPPEGRIWDAAESLVRDVLALGSAA